MEKQALILNEKQLIADCLAGKQQAQRQFYKTYYNQIFGLCLRYANDRLEAKELLNTVFLKAFENLQKYQGEGIMKAWLSRIAINICMDALRKRQNYRKHTTLTVQLPETTISETVIDALAVEDILKCLQKVSSASRTVFSLYVIDGYRHNEIAKMLNISVGTSRWHLSNAKKEMKELLENHSNN